MSDLCPISARNGANSSGSEIMIATTALGTPSSTIMTRLSVPLSSTTAMATETWNSDRRSRRPSGSSAVAASANGRKRGRNFGPLLRKLVVPSPHRLVKLHRLRNVEAGRDAPRAPARPARKCRLCREMPAQDTGIYRLDGRCTVGPGEEAADGMHHRQSRRPGSEREDDAVPCAFGELRQYR